MGLETTVKAGARAMAGKILGETTVSAGKSGAQAVRNSIGLVKLQGASNPSGND